MTDIPFAKHAFITNPSRQEAVLNIQVEGEEIQRFELNKAHLLRLNSEAADILMKDFK